MVTALPVTASHALYIKLGEGGKWEKECIEEQQTLRVGFRSVPLDLCRRPTPWNQDTFDQVQAIHRTASSDPGSATRDTEQLRLFCEAGSDTVWITFFGGRLWWCFAVPGVQGASDQTKTRNVQGKWSSVDCNGQALHMSRLSGKLLSLQGFRGTICRVKEFDYLLRKLNGEDIPEVATAKEAKARLEQALEAVIAHMHWKDFEVLVDLLFRDAGWHRVSPLGDVQKTLDLELLSPLTDERFGVQIKAQAALADFEAYCSDFETMKDFTRFYFVVHSPAADLAGQTHIGRVNLLLPRDIVHWAVKAGLTDWIIAKAG